MNWFEESVLVNKPLLSQINTADIDWQCGTDPEKISKLQIKVIEQDIKLELLLSRIENLEKDKHMELLK